MSTKPTETAIISAFPWTWLYSIFHNMSTVKSLSSDNRSVTLMAATLAYMLGSLVQLVSLALLALVLACASLCLSAALMYWHQQRQKPLPTEPHEAQSVPHGAQSMPYRGQSVAHRAQSVPDSAPQMHHGLQKTGTDLNSLNSSIIYHAQEGNMEQAHRAVRNMRAQGSKPKLVAYGCFLNACAKNSQVKLAEHCLSYMEQDGVELNTICYCTVINVYASAGDIDKAEQFFAKMQMAATVNEEIKPNPPAYNALIKACARVQQIERAEAWFALMKTAGIDPNVVTFTTLIAACAKIRDAERAEKWLRLMSEHKVEANVMTYNTVIDACAKVGDLERSELCFQRMRKEGVTPDRITYNSIINACGQAGAVDCAAEWLESMIKEGLEPCNVSFSTCIGACVKNGDMPAANRWLTSMFDHCVELSVLNYSTLIHAGIKAGDFDFSERLLIHLRSKNTHIEPITYRALIHALAKSNQPERVEEWFGEMVEVYGLNLNSAEDMFGAVISAFCNSRNAPAVLHWLDKMRQWQIPINQSIRAKAIKMLRHTGNIKWARELCEGMNSSVMPAAGPQTQSVHQSGPYCRTANWTQ